MRILYRSSLFAAALLLSAAVFAQQSATPVPDAPAPSQAVPSQAAPSQPPSPQPTGPTVLFDTTMGRISCRLFSKQAPNAVANFVGLATGTKPWTNPKTHQIMKDTPFYDGTTFHRVIPGFMIQGGDPLGTGEGGPGYNFDDEFDPGLNFDVPGRLAMANSGPNTNGSQFFITEAPEDHLDQHYTIFGQCDEPSLWIVKSIARVNRDENDKPIEPVIIRKVTIVPAGQPVPPADNTPSAPAPAQPQP
ncbi:MAG TPA: peptidylprolyl isomerase [Acidobacteriaceae bacterium]|nr:peptidylprolyl isomerase [Acidobacteriaceae bacterium]